MVSIASVAGRMLRMVPEGWGDQRLAELVSGRLPPAGPTVTTLRGGARVELDPAADRAQAVASLLRHYDAACVRMIVEQLPWGGVFFDADAHVGLVSLQVAAARFDVNLHAFASQSDSAVSLRRNAALNPQARLTVISTALGSEVHPATPDAGGTTTVDAYVDEHEIASVDVLRIDHPGRALTTLLGAQDMLRRKRLRAVVVGAMVAAGPGSPTELLVDAGYRRLPAEAAAPQWAAWRNLPSPGIAVFVPSGSR